MVEPDRKLGENPWQTAHGQLESSHSEDATEIPWRTFRIGNGFPKRYEPGRVLAIPLPIASLIGSAPRVVADDVWAKIVWAGMNSWAMKIRASSNWT